MLKDEIGIFHACLAQAFLGLLVLVALVTTKFWRRLSNVFVTPKTFAPIKTLASLITFAIYAQLALGATMRHQHRDLAILDFPTANGAWIPDTSETAIAKINAWRDARGLSDVDAFQIWLQMAHRLLALLIAIAIITFCLRVWRDARRVPGSYPNCRSFGSRWSFARLRSGHGRFGATRPLMSRRRMSRSARSCYLLA